VFGDSDPVPEEWEPGALRQAIWGLDEERARAALGELGRRAGSGGWARDLIWDIARGRLWLAPEMAIPGLRELLGAGPEAARELLKEGGEAASGVVAAALGQEGGPFLKELTNWCADPEVSLRLSGGGGGGGGGGAGGGGGGSAGGAGEAAGRSERQSAVGCRGGAGESAGRLRGAGS
jgi:hypothetical protein